MMKIPVLVICLAYLINTALSESPQQILDGPEQIIVKTCFPYRESFCHPLADCKDSKEGMICSCPEGLMGDGYETGTGCKYRKCDYNQFAYEGYCYEVLPIPKTYQDARRDCELKGGKLVSLVTPGERSKIDKEFLFLGVIAPSDVFLGYDLTKYPGTLQSLDYSIDNYILSIFGDNLQKTNEDCLIYSKVDDKYEIKNAKCTEEHKPFCKIPSHTWPCPDGWIHKDDKCYAEIKEEKTYIEGAIHCAKYGADPVMIETEEEQMMLLNKYLQFAEGLNYAIGLQKRIFTTEKKAKFSLFDIDFDNVKSSANDSATECYIMGSDGKWSSTENSCTTKQRMICEKPAFYLYRCPSTAYYFNQRCYTFSETDSHLNAQKKCQGIGGELVSILTTGENDFVSNLVRVQDVNQFWFGLLMKKDELKWTDQSDYDFTLLPPTQVDNSTCGSITKSKNGNRIQWSLEVCDSKYPGVCKYVNTPCSKSSECHLNAVCDSGQCRCKYGYSGDGKKSCENIDECSTETVCDGQNEKCIDTPGSYRCECIEDHERYPDGLCKHYLYCEQNKDCVANAECVKGKCECMRYFEGDGKKECTDIDECKDSKLNDCDPNAICTNLSPEFTCACKPGYKGDGKSCKKIPRDCNEIYEKNNKAKKGEFELDVDEGGPLQPIQAYCEFRDGMGITIFKVYNKKKSVNSKTDFIYTLNYKLKLEFIRKIVEVSGYCYQEMEYKCFSQTSLIESISYMDYKGRTFNQWGGSSSSKQCLCGQYQACLSAESACNCDGNATDQIDGGKLSDMDQLPLQGYQVTTNNQQLRVNIEIGDINCGPRTFGIPKTCKDVTESGVYLLDVDGAEGPKKPFYIYCDVDNYREKVAILKLRNPPNYPTLINYFLHVVPQISQPEKPGDGEVCYDYINNDEDIKTIMDTHFCMQEVRFDCEGKAELLGSGSFLISKGGKQLTSFATEKDGSCPCGILGTCSGKSSSCNCDGKNDQGTDFGFVTDHSSLPLGCSKVNTKGTQKGYMAVGPMICGLEKDFMFERNCQDWIYRGFKKSYAYQVQLANNDNPLLVQCDMTENPDLGVTVFIPTVAEKCEESDDKLCRYGVDYNVGIDEINKVRESSVYCTQEINYKCSGGMTLLKPYAGNSKYYAYWENQSKEKLHYFSGNGASKACQCGIDGNCSSCHCDTGDNKARSDKGLLTDKDQLPVFAVAIGKDGKKESEFELGPMKCYHIEATCLLEHLRIYKNKGQRSTSRVYAWFTVDPDNVLPLAPFSINCLYYGWARFSVETTTRILKVDDDEKNIGAEKVCFDIKYEKEPSMEQYTAYLDHPNNLFCYIHVEFKSVYSPFTDYVKWYYRNNKPGFGWGDSIGGKECLCGEVDSCKGGRDLACETDAMAFEERIDKGYLIDKDMLPLKKVCIGLTDKIPGKQNVKKSAQVIVGAEMFCGAKYHDYFDIYRRNCEAYRTKTHSNIRKDTIEPKVIAPMSKFTGPKLAVLCDFKYDPPIGVTHVTLKNVCDQSSSNDAQSVKINYNLRGGEAGLKDLIEISSHCEQTVDYSCENAPVPGDGSHGALSYSGDLLNYWGQKGDTFPCSKSGADNSSVVFPLKKDLPISAVKLGAVSGKGNRKLCVKDLRCYNVYRDCPELNNQLDDFKFSGSKQAIDPDQEGGLDAFKVKCTKKFQYTHVGSETTGGSKPDTTTPLDFDDITAAQARGLVVISNFCFQTITKYDVTHSVPVVHGVPEVLDYLGQKYSTWVLADLVDFSLRACSCGVFYDSLEVVRSRCPNHASCRSNKAGKSTGEIGMFTNKDLMPITGFVWNKIDAAKFTVDEMICTPSFKALPKDCNAYLKKKNNPEGEVLISPDGKGSIVVICKRINNVFVTIIPPNASRGPFSNDTTIYYPGDRDQILKLIGRSRVCVQPMKIRSRKIKISQHFSWSKLGGSPQKYIGSGESGKAFCPCSVDNVCAGDLRDSAKTVSERECNQDLISGIAHLDAGLVSDKKNLPIEKLKFTEGFNDDVNEYHIGDLMCSNKPFDVNECAINFNDCDPNHGICNNLFSGYGCRCEKGWQGLYTEVKYLSNGRSCFDDNECNNPKSCDSVSSTCENLQGSYKCHCRPGFKEVAPNTCVDIDECAKQSDGSHLHDCHEFADCRNTLGSYVCMCRPGFRGNGRQCEPTGVCSCWGDPHCTTFDGVPFSYMGACSYTAARDNCTGNLPSGPPSWEIIVKNWRQTLPKDVKVSWVKEVSFRNRDVIVTMKLGDHVTVNNELVSLPYNKNGIVIDFLGRDVRFINDMGIEIRWDSRERFAVNLPNQFVGKVCGFCGNFNQNKKDDMIIGPQCKPKGENTDIVALFGDSWRNDGIFYEDEKCEKTCSTKDPEPCKDPLKSEAERECRNMIERFQKCSDIMKKYELNLDSYLKSCIFDYCNLPDNKKEVLCKTAKEVYSLCNENYKIKIHYRDSKFCPVKCDENMVYTPCKAPCVQTCTPESLTQPGCDIECEEGCECQGQMVFDNGKCIPKEQCGCKMEDGTYMQLGEIKVNSTCTEKCECKAGRIADCKPLKCGQNAVCEIRDDKRSCYCMAGYEGDGLSCKDIDECTKKTDDCDENAACTNTIGSFTCKCKDGFQGDGKKCFNINECELKPKVCSDLEDCFDQVPGYECRCKKGYKRVNGKCEDIDECSDNTNQCHGVSTTCVNTPGSYECKCKDGFVRDNKYNCKDVDECDDPKHNDCHRTLAKCINVPGSFRCECNSGFEGDGKTCKDINECDLNKKICAKWNCNNTIGSYFCECIPGQPDCDIDPCTRIDCSKDHEWCDFGVCKCVEGYERKPDKSCGDEDECEKKKDNCAGKNAFCENTIGSFECNCITGFRWNQAADKCEDVDECKENKHTCIYPAVCVNTEPGHYCKCDKGYAGHCGECRDVDECSSDHECDKSHGKCINTVGSYKCECQRGFTLSGNDCIDINECHLGLHSCRNDHAVCINNVGSYNCRCEEGYALTKSGHCADVNECVESSKHACDVNALCTNLEGSYKCKCRDGFQGDGLTCKTDEHHFPCGDVVCDYNALCVNGKCQCKLGFEFNQETGKCIDIDECLKKDACDQNAECLNVPGTFVCSCRSGFIKTKNACHKKDEEIDYCLRSDFCIHGNCVDNVCSCASGYILIDNKCEDVNECDQGMCGDQICLNKDGTYECGCTSGTQLVTEGEVSRCEVREVCDLNEHNCEENSYCLKSLQEGGFKCQCEPGFEPVNELSTICKAFTPTCDEDCPVGSYCDNRKCVCKPGLVEKLKGDTLEACVSEGSSCNPDSCDESATCEDMPQGGFKCVCPEGYYRDGITCRDVNECLTGTDQCPPHSDCYNNDGAHECKCHVGYIMNESSKCIEIERCNCGSHGVCINDKCICDEGYESDNRGICVDKNECIAEDSPCHTFATCENTVGSYICTCLENYEGDGKFCDYNECSAMESPCPEGQACKNTNGGYYCDVNGCAAGYLPINGVCIKKTRICGDKDICGKDAICRVVEDERVCSCDNGFTGDGKICIDIDECSDQRQNECGSNSICINEPGTYRCVCRNGYQKTIDLSGTGSCTDINECMDPNACARNANCTNEIGSYSCKCQDGYFGNGELGCDLDTRCQRFEKGCHKNAVCRSREDSPIYECICQDGYKGDGITSCVDVDECSDDSRARTCHKNAICTNSDGSYSCKCPEGFNGDGYHYCVKDDPCLKENKCTGPLQRCINMEDGSYECGCKMGAEKNPSTGDCEDINECEGSGSAVCSKDAVCSNTVGSFICKCRQGFEGDGVHCTDIDECQGYANCSVNAFCINKEGSFDCECQATHMGDGFDCVDVDECKDQSKLSPNSRCSPESECINKDPGYECKCKEGLRGNGFDCYKENPCDKSGSCDKNSVCYIDAKTKKPYCTCRPGYDKDEAGKCNLIDECKYGKDDCKKTETCVDLPNGFMCECKKGFKEVEGECVDKDECDPESPDFAASECSASGGKCVNTPGDFKCVCPGGNVGSKKKCESVNECKSGKNDCDKNAWCIDLKDGYKCVCLPGFTGEDGKKCDDVDECKKLKPCHANSKCTNTIGGYQCSCADGYQPDESGNKCQDQDECFLDEKICGDNARCVNKVGTYSCVCVDGYQWDKKAGKCVDIDECEDDRTNPCHELAECSNIPGSCTCKCRPGYNGDGRFNCEETDNCPGFSNVGCPNSTVCRLVNDKPECTCRTGYEEDPAQKKCDDEKCVQSCNDINECINKKNVCHELARCSNEDGKFVCNCKSGTQGDGRKNCNDINECAENKHTCNPKTSICQNIDGTKYQTGYICECLPGFTKNPETSECEDIDECALSTTNDCNENEKCVNYEGGFKCLCPQGYLLSEDKSECNDVDECKLSPDICLNGKCVNMPGSYSCDCNDGYQQNAEDPQICEDIDECQRDFLCKNEFEKCVNMAGSYKCFCADGYKLVKGVCQNIDECAKSSTNKCKAPSSCVDTSGSYKCECPAGSEHLDEYSCLEINECQLGLDSCEAINGKGSRCVNEADGFSCACPEGYERRNGSRTICVDINECQLNRCPPNSICKNSKGSYACSCKSGYRRQGDACVDLNECEAVAANKRNLCGTGKCVNLVGSYRCECPQGFIFRNGQCEDIDECSVPANSNFAAKCGSGAACLNKPGGYDCVCKEGFELKDKACVNIDECQFRYTCSYGKCIDLEGSYACDCPDGYKFDYTARKCLVINECMEPNRCGGRMAGRCKKDGNRIRCECYYGFQNIGDVATACEPINWCSQKKTACPPHSHCVNGIGGASCECNSGFVRDTQGVCININECNQAQDVCHNKASCFDTEGSYKCKCLKGYVGDGISSCQPVCQVTTCREDQSCTVTAENQPKCSCDCIGEQCQSVTQVCSKLAETYDSYKDFMETKCKLNLNVGLNYYGPCKESCEDVTCPAYHTCALDKIGRPMCTCVPCTFEQKNSGPLCSTKGYEYKSECELIEARCSRGSHLEEVKNYGSCKQPIPCHVSSWSKWSACSKSCGLGDAQRTRYVSKEAKNDGHCSYSLKEVIDCYLGPCPDTPCAKKACSPGAYCKVVDGEAVCNCQNSCPEAGDSDVICGKLPDGSLETFNSLCQMQRKECNDKIVITFLNRGKCGSNTDPDPAHCSMVVDYKKVTDEDQCTSVNPVRVNQCAGGCGLRPNICCVPKDYKNALVQFNCGGKGTTLKPVKMVASCNCQLVQLKENEAKNLVS